MSLKNFFRILRLTERLMKYPGHFEELNFKQAFKIAKSHYNTDWEKLSEEKHFRNLYSSSGILLEQKYSNLHRYYYHISDKKFKKMREFGEGRLKLAFFALDPKFCFEFTKLRFSQSDGPFYLYKGTLTKPLNIFNIKQKKCAERLLVSQEIINLYNNIPDKDEHQAFWKFLEKPIVLNKIASYNEYDGVAMDFHDDGFNMKTMGLALFQASLINLIEYAECNRHNTDSLEWKELSYI